MFTRTAYELKNGSRRTVLPTRELAESLKNADPTAWRYARIAPVKVSFFRPGFGTVETFTPTTRSKSSTSTVAPSTETSTNAPVATPRKRGRPTNAERAARAAAAAASAPSTDAPVRGIAPANPTESSVPSTTTAPSA